MKLENKRHFHKKTKNPLEFIFSCFFCHGGIPAVGIESVLVLVLIVCTNISSWAEMSASNHFEILISADFAFDQVISETRPILDRLYYSRRLGRNV